MPTLLVLAILAFQDPGASRAADLVRDLSHDLIEVRERAQAALIKLGEPAYSEVRLALESRDAEVRFRAARILKSTAFLAVPEVVKANLELLGSDTRDRWLEAAEKLLTAGTRAVPALRTASGSKEARVAFRARQIAAILESTPVRGMKFGVLVDGPDVTLGGPIPGFDVFINVSPGSLRFELD
ncbi:MAG TPA: hypothetical protein VJU16_05280, partial [Planctomycetota bacterium]|nr:hypothetical protein [Planctomycetota bacterium]